MPKRKNRPPAERPGPDVVPYVPEDSAAAPEVQPRAREDVADDPGIAPYVPANIADTNTRNGSDGDHNQEAVVLAALANAAAAVLEHSNGVCTEVRVRGERVDRRHNDHIAAGLLQGPNEITRRRFARGIENVGKVVDRLSECRNLLCARCQWDQQHRNGNEPTKRTKSKTDSRNLCVRRC